MSYYWKHVLQVETAGLTIRDPKIEIDIKRESDQTPPQGFIAIYNLSEQHEAQIHDRGKSVILTGGYEGFEALLFNGAVQRVERERRKMSRITRLKLAGKVVAEDTLLGVSMRGYSDVVPLRQIVTDIISDMGLTAGPLDAVPNTSREWYWDGSASHALGVALKPHGLTWYEDDGVIRINAPKTVQPDSETIRISPETGLIGSPSITDDGARARCLINPLIRVGWLVIIESEAVEGSFKVASLQHVGDNWRGHLYTELELRENV